MIGTLYIVATPIGNMGDITFRAVETLKNVDLILAEDTRVTCNILKHYDIQRDILSYHQQSNDKKKSDILLMLLTGKDIALVTDAGTPGISDPGNELVDFILAADPNIQVVPIPGPSSITTLLSVSGVRSDKFVFVGYFPKKGKTKFYEFIENVDIPVVFFESPYRIQKTLDSIREHFGDQKHIIIGQELTKMYEKIKRGKVIDVINQLAEEKSKLKRVKGEFTCILSPN